MTRHTSRSWMTALLLLLPLAPLRAEADWTVLAYMSGDDAGENPMETVQIDALIQTAQYVPAGASVHFVAQLDRGPRRLAKLRPKYYDPDYAGATRWLMQGGKVTAQQELGEVNSGDPATLYDFLRWGVEHFPAKRYALVISGHGSGILTWRGPGSVADGTPGRVVFDPFTAYDDTDQDALTVFELREVLAHFRDRLHGGRKLDLMAFESCLPSAMEAVYELRDGVEVLVGSPDLTYYGTFPHDWLVATLARAPATTPFELAEVICKHFLEKSKSNQAGDAMMAWRTDRIEEVVSTLSRLSQELLRAAASGGRLSFQGQHAYWADPYYYWDLGLMARACAQGTTGLVGTPEDAEIRRLGAELSQAIRSARVAGWYDGDLATRKVDGLSLFWPKEGETYQRYRSYYKAFESSRVGSWDELLDVMKGR